MSFIEYSWNCDTSHSSDTNVPIICVGTRMNLCRYNFKYLRLNNVILIFNKIFFYRDGSHCKNNIISFIILYIYCVMFIYSYTYR